MELLFPPEYPFKPYKIIFKTKIYHPLVDKYGNIYPPSFDENSWSPGFNVVKMINKHLVSVLYHYDYVQLALDQDIANHYKIDK